MMYICGNKSFHAMKNDVFPLQQTAPVKNLKNLTYIQHKDLDTVREIFSSLTEDEYQIKIICVEFH